MGFPRTERALRHCADCRGAAIGQASRVAYRNRCRRLQPHCPAAKFFCPSPRKKPGLSAKMAAERKICHQDSTRRQIPCIFWLSEVAETSDHNKTKTILFSGCSPPPKTHTSIAATWARGFPNRGPFSFLRGVGPCPSGADSKPGLARSPVWHASRGGRAGSGRPLVSQADQIRFRRQRSPSVALSPNVPTVSKRSHCLKTLPLRAEARPTFRSRSGAPRESARVP